ncbi:MAG: zinc ABC transporter substrate-binding protein [Ignavibacteriales bacterium]|nr:zinc ABC transporter substrate-binding protein [Ignavibacteriales bacterium]
MNSLFRLILLTLLSGSLFAQGLQERLKVVTTINYLRYFAQEIGGNRVDAIALANPRQDPHYVTPTPTMNQITNRADLFVENGLSLDLWAKNVIDASGNPEIQPGTPGHLVATLNVPIKELPTEISRSWGDIHPQGNPHCWLDPINAKIIAENIAERLAKIDPAHAAYYQERLESFRDRIDASLFGEELLKIIGKKAGDILSRKARNNGLMEWLESKGLSSRLGGWMAQAKRLDGAKVISYHKTYVYLADRINLHIVGELEEKPGIPPPAKRRYAIVEQVRREQIKVILNDNFYSRDAADYVASKTGASVLITHIDVGAAEETDTYEKLISSLIESLVLALK